MEYVTRVRMDKAKDLLKLTSLKSYKVASEVGYSDPQYFCVIFKSIPESPYGIQRHVAEGEMSMKREWHVGSFLFKFRSIQSSISVVFSCLILFLIIITSYISYRLSAEAVELNSKHYISEIVQQVNINLQSYITNMEDISILASTNKDVKYYITGTSFLGDEERRPYEKRISDLFQSILITRKDIASIMVLDTTTDLYLTVELQA